MSVLFNSMLLGSGAAVQPPTYLDSTLLYGGSGTSRVATAPTGIVAGTHLSAICWSVNSVDTWTAPAGWSSAIATLTGTGTSVALFEKIAGGSEPGTYTFTGAANVAHFVMLFAYNNATAISANNLATATIDGADPKVASSMSVVASRMLIAVVGLNNNTVTLVSGPSGMTSREQQFSNNAPRGAAYELLVPSTGASGSKSFDISGAVQGAAFLFEIQ